MLYGFNHLTSFQLGNVIFLPEVAMTASDSVYFLYSLWETHLAQLFPRLKIKRPNFQIISRFLYPKPNAARLDAAQLETKDEKFMLLSEAGIVEFRFNKKNSLSMTSYLFLWRKKCWFFPQTFIYSSKKVRPEPIERHKEAVSTMEAVRWAGSKTKFVDGREVLHLR